MDERTMREIYLTAFEKVVKEAQPLGVMASYNKVHNVHSTRNKEALETILRKEWGFKGIVISDWGATHDRAAAVEAGTDLTMPFEKDDQDVIDAVKNGQLKEETLDECCVRLLQAVYQTLESHREEKFDQQRAEEVSLHAAEESMVLLKNDDGILPLNKEKSVALIGLFAEKPRFQGGGSSNITVTRTVSALDAAAELDINYSYAQGYDESGDTTDALIAEAVKNAKAADYAVIFAGLHDEMETEGTDRIHMRMSEGHNRLITEVCKANPNTVVVLHNGSPVEMPWIDSPKAVLEAYLGGQMVGQAVLDVLYGAVNPSGHLAETFPLKLSDNPSYLSFGGEGNRVNYQEGIFIGYRYYETKQMKTLFPFGWGLSYTDFEYSNLKLSSAEIGDNDELKVSVTVKNTGKVSGKALVQLYVAPHHVDIIRPVRELKGFEKVSLEPGECREVEMTLDRRSFAHWNTIYHDWKCESGEYDIQIGLNAHDIVLSQTVSLSAEPLIPFGGFSDGVPMNMLADTAEGKVFLDQNIIHMVRGMARIGYIPEQILQVVDQLPGGLTLDAMNMLAQRAGRSQGAGGKTGLDALLSQPVSILRSFLPEDKKNELKQLLQDLNERFS